MPNILPNFICEKLFINIKNKERKSNNFRSKVRRVFEDVLMLDITEQAKTATNSPIYTQAKCPWCRGTGCVSMINTGHHDRVTGDKRCTHCEDGK